MKIREGFVSNSSSSSFILALDTIPKSVEQMHEMLFGEDECMVHVPYGNKDDLVSTMDVAARVFELMEEAKFEDMEGILSRDAIKYDSPQYKKFRQGKDGFDWDMYNFERMKIGRKEAENFIKQNPNKVFVHLNAEDKGDIDLTIHEGEFLRDVCEYIRISMH